LLLQHSAEVIGGGFPLMPLHPRRPSDKQRAQIPWIRAQLFGAYFDELSHVDGVLSVVVRAVWMRFSVLVRFKEVFALEKRSSHSLGFDGVDIIGKHL
jgi:hypothetical protein